MPQAKADCAVSLGSQAAWYAFAMRFGLPTLGVSGRFTINHSELAFAALKKLCVRIPTKSPGRSGMMSPGITR